MQVAISVSEMTPTNQTEVILEGLRVLVPLRATEETLDSLTIEELVHLFNLYIDVLHERQRDTLIKYVLHCVTLSFLVSHSYGLKAQSRRTKVNAKASRAFRNYATNLKFHVT